MPVIENQNECFFEHEIKKLTSVFCVCPVIDHEFHYNIFEVAVDPQTKFIVNNRTGGLNWYNFVYSLTITNCPLSLVDTWHKL